MKTLLKKISFTLTVILLLNTVSCGTILYPERRGQAKGRIDPGIAILDAILFLPGILPGVVAFAVDFVTGAIYLPGSEAGLDMEDGMAKSDTSSRNIALSRSHVDALERILSDKTGKPVHLNPSDIKVLRINDMNYIAGHFTLAKTEEIGLVCRK